VIASALGLDNIFGGAGVDTVSCASVPEGGAGVTVNLKHIIQHTAAPATIASGASRTSSAAAALTPSPAITPRTS
jgi:hypothetical protein